MTDTDPEPVELPDAAAEEDISAADASRRVDEDPDEQVSFPDQSHPSGTDASGPEDL